MNNFFLTLTLIFSVSLSSNDYRGYYEGINQAELSIVKQDYKNATYIYKTIFKDYSNHDSKDLFNASLCAIKSEDFQFAEQCIQDLMLVGYSMDKFESKTFKNLPPSIFNSVSKKYDSLHTIYLSKYDNELKYKLDSLHNVEQYYIKKHLHTFTYDSLIWTHAKFLKDIISKKGIPEVPMFQGFKLPIDVLRHHFGVMNMYKNVPGSDNSKRKKLDFTKYSIKNLLLDAVSKGQLSPQLFSSIIEYNELDSTKTIGKVLIVKDLSKQEIKIEYPPKEKLELINKNRYILFLESFEDAVKKTPGIEELVHNYPFKEHLEIVKKMGAYRSNLKFLPVESIGYMVEQGYRLEKETMNNSESKEFILPQTSYSFCEIFPEK